MKRFILILLLASLSLTLSKSALSAPKKREVHIECGNLFSVGPSKPLLTLSAALKKYPRAKRLRLTWDSSASLGTDWVTAIYDRDKRIIWLENTGDYLSNEDEDATKRTEFVRRWLFRNVTERSIRRLAAKYGDNKNNDGAGYAYLPYLTEFGCTQKVLRDWSRVYQVPQNPPTPTPVRKR